MPVRVKDGVAEEITTPASNRIIGPASLASAWEQRIRDSFRHLETGEETRLRASQEAVGREPEATIDDLTTLQDRITRLEERVDLNTESIARLAALAAALNTGTP